MSQATAQNRLQSKEKTIQIRIDADLKKELELIFTDMGINMSTAVNLYFRRIARDRKIPFEISARSNDAFYSATNQQHLRNVIASHSPDNMIVKTMEELKAMEK